MHLASLLRDKKDKKYRAEIEKLAQQAVKNAPKDSEAHLALANALKDNHKDAAAIKEYEEALKLKPNHPSAAKIKEFIDFLKNRPDSRI
ncbi:MAG: hypothetical protein K2X29_02835 [Candidatus Obscuribacterales bacterium]|nr:hypothetical protein [Candidatus Obscuribacterales bacterium]